MKSDQLHMPHVDLQARSDFKEFLQFQQLVGDCDCFDAVCCRSGYQGS